MYPFVIFILFLFLIKLAFTFTFVAWITKGFFYYLGMLLIGNLYCLSLALQNVIMDTYFQN